jgi:two-component system, LuxR family, response regulator FixJ
MTNSLERASTPPVYVIDDDDAVCDSLALLLTSAGYSVRCVASSAEFLDAAPSLPPGCLVCDVRMPEFDGVELLARLKARGLNFPAVMITGQSEVDIAVRAMKAGAVDFIEKPFEQEKLLDSLEQAQQRLRPALATDAAARVARERVARLTARERDVLDGLVAGLPNKAIAYDLLISPRTVEVYRARIMEKMQAHSLAELVRLALAAGCDPNPPTRRR